jgi:hypothetical protein
MDRQQDDPEEAEPGQPHKHRGPEPALGRPQLLTDLAQGRHPERRDRRPQQHPAHRVRGTARRDERTDGRKRQDENGEGALRGGEAA